MKARKLIWATADGKKRMPNVAAEHGLDVKKDRKRLLEMLAATRPEGSLAKSAYVVVYTVNGKRHQRTFDKKKQADAWIARAQLDVLNGTHVPDSASMTVREAGKQWIEACKHGTAERPALERATWEGYEQHLDHHIFPYLGDLKLSRLTPDAVHDFEARLAAGTPPVGADAAKPRSRAMIRKIRSSLGALLAEFRVPRNVVYEQRRPRSKGHVEQRHEDDLELGVDIPKPDEIRAIIKELNKEKWRRWRPLILTAIFTGLRASELRGLRWRDVDFERAPPGIQVRQRRDRYGDEGPPKSKAGRRIVPITPKLVAVLREWQLACPKGKDGLVFPNGVGRVESHANIINRCWWPLQVAAGVAIIGKDNNGKVVLDEDGEPVRKPRYTGLHALRHFYASWCINSEAAGRPRAAAEGRADAARPFLDHHDDGHLRPPLPW
jgi:integrase